MLLNTVFHSSSTPPRITLHATRIPPNVAEIPAQLVFENNGQQHHVAEEEEKSQKTR